MKHFKGIDFGRIEFEYSLLVELRMAPRDTRGRPEGNVEVGFIEQVAVPPPPASKRHSHKPFIEGAKKRGR